MLAGEENREKKKPSILYLIIADKNLRITKPLIKINFTNGCVGLEIWKNITDVHTVVS